MKKITLFIFISAIFLNSCSLFFNEDTTDNVSYISSKPVVELLGEAIISMQKGETYVEEGISAFAADTVLDYEIVSGEVDPNSIGFYIVTYKAQNGFGWSTLAYRAVLVHDGDPYQQPEIEGNYKKGFFFDASITKYSKLGYWSMSNVWWEEGVEFPIIFAERKDSSLAVVPGEHLTKGRYTGVGEFTGDSIKFTLTIVPPSGDVNIKNFGWKKL